MNWYWSRMNQELNRYYFWFILTISLLICNFFQQVLSPKHFGMHFDTKLNFQKHLNNVLSKVNKTIAMMRNLFYRRNLGFGKYSIYKTPSWLRGYYVQRKLQWLIAPKSKPILYKAAPAITGAKRSTYREKLYQELVLELLRKRRWYRKLCYFFKIFKRQSQNFFS